MKKISIQGLRVDNISKDEALSIVRGLLRSSRQSVIAFVNAHSANMARRDPAYRKAINSFDLVLPDGAGIATAAFLKGEKISENLNGTDFCPELFRLFNEENKKIFLFGARQVVTEKARTVLKRTYPNLQIGGLTHGIKAGQRKDEIFQAMEKADTEVVFVAMGTPLQEKWIYDHRDQLHAKIFLAVGGLFDFIADVNPRAPRWIRKIGMEWLFRMCCEPQRLWKRYVFGNPEFLFFALLEAFREYVRSKKNA